MMDGISLERCEQSWLVWRDGKYVGRIGRGRDGRVCWLWHNTGLWDLRAADLVTVPPRGWESVDTSHD